MGEVPPAVDAADDLVAPVDDGGAVDVPAADRDREGGHDAPPVAADLAGAWYAVVPPRDGGVSGERRVRFFNARYVMVVGSPAGYCGEGGPFSVSNTTVTFQPDTTAATGRCPVPTVRTETVEWTDEGIVFQVASTAGGSEPVLHRRARNVPKVFATIETHDGNWAGDTTLPGATVLDKADEFCARSLARPDGQTYKAMMTDGKTRTGNPAVGWILKPETTYFQADGVLNIFRTDPMALSKTSTNHPILNNMGISYYWCGLSFGFGADSANCSGWTSASETVLARVADASQASFTFTSSVVTQCGGSTKNGLICISQ